MTDANGCVLCGRTTLELRVFPALSPDGERVAELWCCDCVGRSKLQWEKGLGGRRAAGASGVTRDG